MMKKRILYGSVFLFPFLMMIGVNEYVKTQIGEKGYHRKGTIAINSAKKFKEKCSWICHNDTDYCQNNHVKFAKPYFDKIDKIYFGLIGFLKSTGNYRLANILFLVILSPLLIYFLLIQSIELQLKINSWKHR